MDRFLWVVTVYQSGTVRRDVYARHIVDLYWRKSLLSAVWDLSGFSFAAIVMQLTLKNLFCWVGNVVFVYWVLLETKLVLVLLYVGRFRPRLLFLLFLLFLWNRNHVGSWSRSFLLRKTLFMSTESHCTNFALV